MSLHALLIAGCDAHPIKEKMQATLMAQFLSEIPVNVVKSISEDREVSKICDWNMQNNLWQVTCFNGIVEGIILYWRDHGNYMIEYAPNTVERLFVVSCRQLYTIDTRSFPLHAYSINLSDNRLFGGVDLGALPPKMAFLHLENNNFDGQVDLTRLPLTLRKLKLGKNNISQSIILYGHLPAKIERIELWGNQVGKVKPIYQYDRKNKGVFVMQKPPPLKVVYDSFFLGVRKRNRR